MLYGFVTLNVLYFELVPHRLLMANDPIEKNLVVTNRKTEVVKELVRKCPINILRILNLDIEQQSERYEMDNHLVGNKYVAQHHLEALATMLEVETEENLSKLGLSNS